MKTNNQATKNNCPCDVGVADIHGTYYVLPVFCQIHSEAFSMLDLLKRIERLLKLEGPKTLNPICGEVTSLIRRIR